MDSPRRKDSPSGNYRHHKDSVRSRSPGHRHQSRRSRSYDEDRGERRHHERRDRGDRGGDRGDRGGDRGDRGGDRYHSRSRSPMSGRKRHSNMHGSSHRGGGGGGGGGGPPDNPEPTRCLGVFGMGLYTTETELQHVFAKYGPLEKVQVVKDAKTGRSRGFAFVYFESLEDAKLAKEQCTGLEIDGRRIRVDYSITQRPHTPTPGIYMGRPTITSGRYDKYDRNERGYRRSPSPYYEKNYRSSRRGYERSRSRSYSPRRY
ncbi:transformer-2 protein homolog alpha isoform X2 [Daphnia magna]|uniref:Uncharacterized protein n=2 Tax=Daphnia magna TaxID=35525 RepID=A0ABR0ADV4_9CRUS|nr:transformer-2 protein homolog alpha isoform X2 [Daphnia magna]KAK4023311.1 hypothetical protein OUZ56_008728 [Daphnia magna]KZS07125.1 Transformer-2-like protein [Daphnia magna]